MSPRTTVLVLSASCLAIACGGAPEDPAERVEEIRSRYTASLNGFAVQQSPGTGELAPPDDEGTAAPAEAAPAEAEAEGGAEAAAGETAEVPVRKDVILDILVSRESREPLPGLTVDIEHVGPEPERAVKDSYRAYLDTSEVLRGVGLQIVHRLEDVDYEEGDGFHVEVRHPVPPGERDQYREFREYGESGEGQP